MIPVLRLSCILPLLAAVAPALLGQVFQVNGGASSLYQAQGGTLSVRGPSYSASLGAGTVAGRFVGGANVTKKVGQSTWIGGDDLIHFVLPTDIFDASHYVVAQGVGVMTTLRRTGVFAFAGATSTEFDSPLFEGARAENPAFISLMLRPASTFAANGSLCKRRTSKRETSSIARCSKRRCSPNQTARTWR